MAHKKMTVKFDKNRNHKLYGKYFISIRNKNFGLNKLDFCEIVLDDKLIGMAQVLEVRTVFFHEIDHLLISLDTGMNYADSLDFYFNSMINVQSFETKVDVLYFEMISYHPSAKRSA